MKSLLFAVLVLIAYPLASFADTSDEMKLISGSSMVTITDSDHGTVSYSNFDFNGWEVFIAFGATNSPNLSPFGLDLTSLVATCASGNCTQPLDVFYSDIGFNKPISANGFMTMFSSTQTGNGTTSESAWFSNLDTLFSQQNFIGTVGPFSETNHGEAQGGAAPAVPDYSLTLEQVFTANTNPVSFSVDGDVVAVTPEPSSGVLVLMGLLLIALIAVVRGPLRTNS
jgi:hypothetical protein